MKINTIACRALIGFLLFPPLPAEAKLPNRCSVALSALAAASLVVGGILYTSPGQPKENTTPEGVYLRSRLKELSTVSTVLDALAKRNPQVVVIGEDHFVGNTEEVYPQLLQQLKERMIDLKYLTLELPSQNQSIIDEYLAGTKPLPDVDWAIYFKPTLDAAKKLSLQVVAVDADQQVTIRSLAGVFAKKEDEVIDGTKAVNERNRTISTRINEILSRGGSAVHIGGASHIASPLVIKSDRDGGRLCKLLEGQGQRATSLRLVRSSGRLHNITANDFTSYTKPGGFLPEGPSPIMNTGRSLNDLAPSTSGNAGQLVAEGTVWHDFDAVLYYPSLPR